MDSACFMNCSILVVDSMRNPFALGLSPERTASFPRVALVAEARARHIVITDRADVSSRGSRGPGPHGFGRLRGEIRVISSSWAKPNPLVSMRAIPRATALSVGRAGRRRQTTCGRRSSRLLGLVEEPNHFEGTATRRLGGRYGGATLGHVVYRGPEGETAAGRDDVQRRFGNKPPLPEKFVPRAYAPEEDRGLRRAAVERDGRVGRGPRRRRRRNGRARGDGGRGRLRGRWVLEEYRRKRLEEMKTAAAIPRRAALSSRGRRAPSWPTKAGESCATSASFSIAPTVRMRAAREASRTVNWRGRRRRGRRRYRWRRGRWRRSKHGGGWSTGT